jgi:hypothetical protein
MHGSGVHVARRSERNDRGRRQHLHTSVDNGQTSADGGERSSGRVDHDAAAEHHLDDDIRSDHVV